jgi:uncharacterized membrane protein
MEETFRMIAASVALALEAMVVLAVAIGAIEALWTMTQQLVTGARDRWLRIAWLRFAGWVLIALEFALGADLVRSAIAPSWDEIGKLGAIAAIRTVLGFFLGRDMAEAQRMATEREAPAGP